MALPFDNSERAPADPPAGRFKLAGMWRLFKGETARVQELSATTATASLLGCAAFPWAMPDRTEQLLDSYFWRFVILIAILTAVIMFFIVLIRKNIV